MYLRLAYTLTTVLLVVATVWLVALLRRRQRLQPLVTRDLCTLALVICLLQVAVLPFKGGLGRVPGLDALIYSIPYSLVLLLGLHLVPKPGAAAAIIGGQALLGQLLGNGLNPLWWPYHGWCAWAAEAFGLTSRRHWVALAVTRGVVAYSYYYLLAGPLLYHKYYAPWFVALKVGLGAVGCAIGACLADQLARRLQPAVANPMG